MGGGNSKIKVDGIPPKKKIELSSSGNEDYLNFINMACCRKMVATSGSEITLFKKILEKDDYIYILAGVYADYTVVKLAILRYSLKNGFDMDYMIETNYMVSSSVGMAGMTFINDEEILIAIQDDVYKFNINSKEFKLIKENTAVFGQSELVYFKNNLYVLQNSRNNVNGAYTFYIYKAEITDDIKLTQLGYYSNFSVSEYFIYKDDLWFSNGSKCIKFDFTQGAFTETISSLRGEIVKINGKLHSFKEVEKEGTIHCVLEETGWVEKRKLSLGLGFNKRNTGISIKEGYFYISEGNLWLMTDKLYLEKRRE